MVTSAKTPVAAADKKGPTPNMQRVLVAFRKNGNQPMTAAEIAAATKINKGKRLPEMVEQGWLKELTAEEGVRGKRFVATAVGRKALEKAEKDAAKEKAAAAKK